MSSSKPTPDQDTPVTAVIRPLMTYDDVATYLNVSRRTVERMVAQGLLRKAKLQGNTARFRPTDVEKCLDNVS